MNNNLNNNGSERFLVLEVKGGGVEYDPETRGWKSRSGDGRVHHIKDPFEQARKNTHQLKSQILKQSFPGLEKLPCAFAVVFPDCVYAGPVPPRRGELHRPFGGGSSPCPTREDSCYKY